VMWWLELQQTLIGRGSSTPFRVPFHIPVIF
jgi:hypothetical protein